VLTQLYTIEEGETGLMICSHILSKPEMETESEQQLAKVLNHVFKRVELELARLSESGTVMDGKGLDALASKYAKEEGFTDVFEALRKAGFEPRT